MLLICIAGLQTLQAARNPEIDSLELALERSMKAPQGDNKTFELLRELAKRYFTIDPAKAMEYTHKSASLADTLTDSLARAAVYNHLGQIYRSQNLFEASLEFYLKSLEIYESLHDSQAILYNYIDVGNIHYDRHADALAEKYYLKALQMAEARKDTYALALSYTNMGMVNYYISGKDKTLYYLHKALQLRLSQPEKKPPIIDAYRYIAEAYAGYKERDSSTYYFRLALKLAEEDKNLDEISAMHYSLGRLYLKYGNENDKAISQFNQSLHFVRKTGTTFELPDIYTYMAKAYRNKGKTRTGIQYLDSALVVARRYGYLLREKRIYNDLSEFYEEVQDHDKALQYYLAAMAIKDSAFDQENLKKMLLQQARYELNRKDQEVRLSEQQTQLHEAELKKKRNANKLLQAVVLFVLLGGVVALAAYRNIHRRNHALQDKNHIIEEQTRELRQARNLAETSMKAKADFLSNMSHEIRTPMNAIIGFTDLIFMENPDNSKRLYLDYIKQTSARLLEIINDILDISKIESGKVELEKLDLDIEEMLLEIQRKFAPLAAGKGLEIILVKAPQMPARISADRSRILQMIYNLLGNALKFTSQGYIKLEIAPEAQDKDTIRLRIRIEDSGIGIAEDKLQTIFESFEQAHAERQRAYGGTGLGLTITRKLAELMGGSLDVQSLEGKGSVFTLYISAAKSEKTDTGTGKEIKYTLPEAAPAIPPGLKVLGVEDNALNQIYLKRLLQKMGIAADVAATGEEAVDMASHSAYDLILMDIRMPGMDGIEATRQIRQQNAETGLIYGLTADIFPETKNAAMAAGMDGVILKPVKQDELAQLLRLGNEKKKSNDP